MPTKYSTKSYSIGSNSVSMISGALFITIFYIFSELAFEEAGQPSNACFDLFRTDIAESKSDLILSAAIEIKKGRRCKNDPELLGTGNHILRVDITSHGNACEES